MPTPTLIAENRMLSLKASNNFGFTVKRIACSLLAFDGPFFSERDGLVVPTANTLAPGPNIAPVPSTPGPLRGSQGAESRIDQSSVIRSGLKIDQGVFKAVQEGPGRRSGNCLLDR